MFRKINLLIQGILTFKDWHLWVGDRFKILTPGKITLFRLRNGISFFLTQGEQGFGSFQEIFIEERYNKYYKIKSGDKIVDIGSGIGEYIVYSEKRGANAVGYEADEKRFLFSKLNILINKCKGETFHKRVVSLDDIGNSDIDFLKMDIEGGEFKIAENTKDFRRFKNIAMEFHDLPEPFENKLKGQNFDVKTEYTSKDSGYLYATRK